MKLDLNQTLSLQELRKSVKHFLTPPELVFEQEMCVEVALRTIKNKDGHPVDYFYVIDEGNILQGIITLSDLVYHPPFTPLKDFVERDVIQIEQTETLESALKLMASHHLLVLPVVNHLNQYVGALEISPHEEEASLSLKKLKKKHVKEDIFQFIGLTIETESKSAFKEYRYRMPWLICNLVSGIICAFIGEYFKTTLMHFVIMALFIPLILTLSESVAIQSMTLSLRFLHSKKIRWSQVAQRIFVECKTSILLSMTCALLLSIFYMIWATDIKPIAIISLSLIISIFASSCFGVLFPVLLHLFRLDPKVAAGPLVLMLTDIATMFIYLGLGTYLLL